MNFGVLGYSSFQGLELLKRQRPRSAPRRLAHRIRDERFRGRRLSRQGRRQGGRAVRWRDRAKAIADSSELLRPAEVLRAGAAISSADHGRLPEGGREDRVVQGRRRGELRRHRAVDARLAARLRPKHSRDGDARRAAQAPASCCSTTSCGPRARIARCCAAIARDEHVPLVDSLRIIADERTRIERGMEDALSPGTGAAADPPRRHRRTPARARRPWCSACTKAPIRCRGACRSSATTRRSATWCRTRSPCTTMGRDGDERAGDHVWSYRAAFPAGTRLKYVYTNSGRSGAVGRTRCAARAGTAGGRRRRTAARCTCRSNRSAGSTCRPTTGTPTPSATTSSPAPSRELRRDAELAEIARSRVV